MAGQNVTRKLSAILSADVVGFSRLMEADENATIRMLDTYRLVIDELIENHRGRVFGSAGDSVIAEFASVVDAVECAVDVQRGMAARNADVPGSRRIEFRIGVNLGDVIIEGDDIYGDGVNVAARLQEIADPGGVCIAGTVFEQVGRRTDLSFDDLGEQKVKNIGRPIRAYRAQLGSHGADETSDRSEPLPLPDKPSIAVLPFTNMSGDPEQEYFSDGITEDIITELSRFRSLFVIARNSSFHYKGQSPKVQDVGSDLGVQYVVEGSVRKAGNRVRITALLVEAETGNHIWAERYDRELEDIFDVQDDVVGAIAVAVPGRLGEVAVERARHKPTENMTAYDYVLRGDWHRERDYTDPNALAMYEKAIAADPRCARAYGGAAAYHSYSVWAHGIPSADAHSLARSFIEQALALDESDPRIHSWAADTYIEVGEHDLARRHVERAFALNPNDASIMWRCGLTLAYLGDHDEALQWHQKALRVDPHFTDGLREVMFDANYMARRYDEAIALFRGWPSPPAHMYAELAAAYAQLDRMDEAREAIERYLGFSLDVAQGIHHHVGMCARREDRDHWLEGYRKAGLDV